MAENKVVIRVSVNKANRPAVQTAPKTVTVWHLRRILVAIIALIVLIAVLFMGIGVLQTRDDGTSGPVVRTELSPPDAAGFNKASVGGVQANTKIDSPLENNNSRRANSADNTLPVVRPQLSRPPAIIYSRKVVRASLASLIKDYEPSGLVQSPVRLVAGQKLELYYFNEIKPLGYDRLFHLWRKDGKVIYKKPLEFKNNKTRVVSGKILTLKDKGVWQIELVDDKGKVYSEVNFLVIAE